jgi:hypothetical protein
MIFFFQLQQEVAGCLLHQPNRRFKAMPRAEKRFRQKNVNWIAFIQQLHCQKSSAALTRQKIRRRLTRRRKIGGKKRMAMFQFLIAAFEA